MLAVACRKVAPDHAHAVVGDETELVLCGFAPSLDPPKASTVAALQELRRSHVQIKLLTVVDPTCAELAKRWFDR